jgi:hydroxymethylpyrimidine pyrophosphatase-like HAD family hydrolase
VFAVGDHLNDLPMLSSQRARHLATVANAAERVRTAVRQQGGFVSSRACGWGVYDALRRLLPVTTATD